MAWFLTEPFLFMLVFNQIPMKPASLLTKKDNFLLIVIGFVAFSLFNSCEKDSPNVKNIVKGEAKIKLINASQKADSIDFYINDAKINTSALVFGESSDYIKIESGTQGTRVNQDLSILATAAEFTYVPTLSYTSFFVEDKTGKGEILIFEDNLGAVESGKVRIRFINLSSNFTNAVNIMLPGGELLVHALPFKETSGYFLVQANTNLGVSIIGSSAFKLALGSEFEAGKNYTVWLSGSSNANLSINKITYN